MTRRLLTSYLTLAAVLVLLLAVPLGVVFGDTERRHLVDGLRRDALALALRVEAGLADGTGAGIDPVVREYAASTAARVVVVDARGRGVADSDIPRGQRLGSYVNRPEIASAIRGDEATGERSSRTLGGDLFFVAVPVATGGKIHGAVRLTYPLSVVEARIRRAWGLLALFGLAVLAVTSLVSVVLAGSLGRPLAALAGTARRLGDGDLGARVEVPRGPPESRVLAEAFNDTAAKLGQLVEAQQAFVADASHQLRSPLAALRLRLENLEPDVADGGRAELEGALTEVRRLSELVDGLLALARATPDGGQREPVDVAAVATERRAAWAPYADERGVRLVVESEPAVALVTPGTVEQILDNLLSNALEYAPAGTAVTVDVRRSDDRVTIGVGDAGPGMSEAERARAFERFWRSPAARASSGGTGLGLAIVRQLARSDGGDAELHEAPGGGLRAVVRLRPA